MLQKSSIDTIDYLIVGHLTIDQTVEGPRLGGTATYAGLTAQALGLRVGIVSSWGEEIPIGPLISIPIHNIFSEKSTTFENIDSEFGRVQRVLHTADQLEFYHIPESWRKASIVHLAPVAQEVVPSIVRDFASSLIAVTPQGWLREWTEVGDVTASDWPEATFVLQHAGAAVFSMEDVKGDEEIIEEYASACPILAVTEGDEGTRLFWNGDVKRFRPPMVDEVDSTGAGDIFAAAFFFRLYTTRDPWEAARFATQLAAYSVTRHGLAAIPTKDEIYTSMVEIF